MRLTRTAPMGVVAAAALAVSAGGAGAASLSDLVAGTTLVEGDVVFDGFAFADFFDDPGETPFAGDRAVSADQIEITTSSTPTTVTLTATITPPISITGFDPGSMFEHIAEFELDFSVSVAPPSTRTLIGTTLGDGDLFSTGDDAFAEIDFDDPTGMIVSNLKIGEGGGEPSVTSDMRTLPNLTTLALLGFVEVESDVTDSAELGTFSLTFELDGTPPPTIPTPAALPLMLGALGGLGLFARRRRG